MDQDKVTMQTSKGGSDSANSLHLLKLQEKADIRPVKKPKLAPAAAKSPTKVQMRIIAIPNQTNNNLDLADVVAPGRAGAAAANSNNRKHKAKPTPAARAGHYSHVGK